MWDVLAGCGWQLRLGPMGGPIGMDFGAVMAIAAAAGADAMMLADVLPEIEAVRIAGLRNPHQE